MDCIISRTLYRYVDWNCLDIPGTDHQSVVPYIGTWIETVSMIARVAKALVVPYIGTWIETIWMFAKAEYPDCRTLYRYVDWNYKTSVDPPELLRRTLYRYVDWNSSWSCYLFWQFVVPYIGTWIETGLMRTELLGGTSRTLYRYVDWNFKIWSKMKILSRSYLI